MTVAIIIGGGLVGSLCACFMAKRGYKVKLYESRNDLRKTDFYQGRSINLALSFRGRKALQAIGLEETMLKFAVPMKGRLLHLSSGDTKSVLYDKRSNECIYSISRNYLNKILLTEAEKHPNVELIFNCKLINANIRSNQLTLLRTDTKETINVAGDLIIGADGAFSTLRRSMQQMPLFQFNQSYIEHGYMEFTITSIMGEKMIKNHLHIWPRGEFMMIALPNYDGSWTVTLFMPFKRFEALSTEEEVLRFFKTTFPDIVPIIGEEKLVETYLENKPSCLVSIKCSRYNSGKMVIIGDAAHAMVPFFGQGMNAGFEDCLLLDNLLEKCNDDMETVLLKFSEMRKDDAQIICDLAMNNYVEMRQLVTKWSYHVRKTIDDLLFCIIPNIWIPLYNSVSFTDISYKRCWENRKWQNKIIQVGLLGLFLFVLIFLIIAIYI